VVGWRNTAPTTTNTRGGSLPQLCEGEPAWLDADPGSLSRSWVCGPFAGPMTPLGAKKQKKNLEYFYL